MPGPIKGVVFDMDGTIVVQRLDFPRIKAEIGVPADEGLLESICLLGGARRAAAEEILLRHELAAAADSRLSDGAAQALEDLRAMGVKAAILTRNCRGSVETVLARHGLHFDAAVTREDSLPKPDPDGVFVAAWRMGVCPGQCLMVGDYEFDIRAGRAAGAVTVLYSPDGRSFQTEPDFQIASMAQLPGLVRRLC